MWERQRSRKENNWSSSARKTAEPPGLSTRRFEAAIDEPHQPLKRIVWSAQTDGFPDQHQLDHVVEVEASVAGHDQGYSGWTLLRDGRLFVVNYTDDTAPLVQPRTGGINARMGISWIRGTFLSPADLPANSSAPGNVKADRHLRKRRVLYNFDGDSCLSTKAGGKGPVPVNIEDVKRLIEESEVHRDQVNSRRTRDNLRKTPPPLPVLFECLFDGTGDRSVRHNVGIVGEFRVH